MFAGKHSRIGFGIASLSYVSELFINKGLMKSETL